MPFTMRFLTAKCRWWESNPHDPITGPWILSPMRLPFRHSDFFQYCVSLTLRVNSKERYFQGGNTTAIHTILVDSGSFDESGPPGPDTSLWQEVLVCEFLPLALAFVVPSRFVFVLYYHDKSAVAVHWVYFYPAFVFVKFV